MASLQFLDAQHGWIVEADTARDRGFVDSTIDGGRTWTRSNVVGIVTYHGGDEAVVDFRNADRGILVTSSQVGEGADFMRSTDGGRTWDGQTRLPEPSMVRFATSRHGVETGYEFSGPALFFTSDGGEHWFPSSVPLPDGWKYANPGWDTGWDLPSLFGSGTGVVAVPVQRPDHRIDLAFYSTSDDGAAWILRSSVLAGRVTDRTVDVGATSAIVSRTGWWVIRSHPATSLQTSDGGGSWTSRRAPAEPARISAASMRDAWLTVFTGHADRVRLMATGDGGGTWHHVSVPGLDSAA